jgi:lipopolysaccharide transport system ATP-binding protein
MTSQVVLDVIDISKDYILNSNNFFLKSNKKIIKKNALNKINFQIKESERIGIIGRNGSGKSTLCKIISGITYPTSGIIKIHGKVSSVLEAGTGFEPELTGYENIFIGGAVLGMSRREITKKVNDIIKFSEIADGNLITLDRSSRLACTSIGISIQQGPGRRSSAICAAF